MFGVILMLVCVAAEWLILYRAYRFQLLRRYPLFYSYLCWVSAVDVCRGLVFYTLHPAWYRNLYWGTEFLTLLVGYGVIIEIIRKSFERYEGAERLARWAVLLVFGLVFAYVGFKSLQGHNWSPASSVGELQRDLRGVQALVIASVLAVSAYYRIRLGRNLLGILLGYGFFTATAMMTLAVRAYAGARFDTAWKAITPYTYFVSLLVWAIALWSYHPNPPPDPSQPLQVDYEALAGHTRGMLGAMRSLLERSARS